MIWFWVLISIVVIYLLIRDWIPLLTNKRSASFPSMPEGSYRVVLDEFEVTCHHPDGTTESAAWADLQKVEIITTDEGPFAPDVFWVLHRVENHCTIPQGAIGDDLLLERLQKLPGFQNDVFITAMGSTSNARFICWVASEST